MTRREGVADWLGRDALEEEARCQRLYASGRAAPPVGGHYLGREMPSRFIFHCNVERFIPRRAAVPFGPPSTQPVARRTPRMCSRSASASVPAAAVGAGVCMAAAF